MSLLMDALRKAEEAKKKAAQKAKSEEAVAKPVAEEQQAEATAEQISEQPTSLDAELSIADMEEVSARSAVPNLETPIDFEDEEDYVLPTSVGSPDAGDIDDRAAAASDEREAEDEAAESEEEVEQASPSAESGPGDPVKSRSAAGFSGVSGRDRDRLQSLDDEEPPKPVSARAKSTAAKPSPLILGSARGARARSQRNDSDESGRRVASNVFAAKKSTAITRRNIQIAAGGGVSLLLLIFATYFYIALNQESAFNIPAGSYVASEFVDDGSVAEFVDVPIVSNLAEQAEDLDAPNSVIADSTGLANLDAPSAVSTDSSLLEELLSASEFPEVAAVDTSPVAEDIQPQTPVQELPLAAVATTVGAAPVESPSPVPTPVSQPGQSAATGAPTNLISFRRQANVANLDPNLDRAYAAYQQGSLAEAEDLYRRALANDPMQRDALLGLATIAIRNGNSAEALDLYSRMLTRNPRDPIARAGLMEILPAASSANQEADLKRLLNEYPNVAALAYAQGNFLASNQRWSEAQQAYFRALQLAKSDAAVSGSVNPDYAFNLAVSLEHLNQSGPAQNYYREALAFAANHPAGFDLAAVRSRLATMTRSSSNE